MAKIVDEKKARRIEEVQALLDAFAKERLPDAPEIVSGIDKLWAQLGRKRTFPITGGTKEVWAAAVVVVIARMNFLFDRSSKHYISQQEICDFFGVSTSRASGRAAEIEKACAIRKGHKGLCDRTLSNIFNLLEIANGSTKKKPSRSRRGSSKSSCGRDNELVS